ncbi:hypothetical protein DFA_09712 [Cavenderia fasciculata]|uniref:Uncharacterized protein n=1 Tax=Cavenderia fasciculata TaxID=261658 RepID=F4Q8E0_CACFS|nr:uncharacterized protein DFA_09712 [Cavenderia fasciculata]EGG16040.1 hypothetical protein DFA_09712 [Cavenderia fasciculata]|eukprot:XP_004352365.1 hypothetical protein DFA_09712 [Cavenderia fasciculata]
MFRATIVALCSKNKNNPIKKATSAKSNLNQKQKKSHKAEEAVEKQREEKRRLKQERAEMGLMGTNDPLIIRAYKELEEEGFFETSGTNNPFKDILQKPSDVIEQ